MLGTKDYVITIGDLIAKWCPDLEWDDIMDMLFEEHPLAIKAKKQVDKAIKEGTIK